MRKIIALALSAILLLGTSAVFAEEDAEIPVEEAVTGEQEVIANEKIKVKIYEDFDRYNVGEPMVYTMLNITAFNNAAKTNLLVVEDGGERALEMKSVGDGKPGGTDGAYSLYLRLRRGTKMFLQTKLKFGDTQTPSHITFQGASSSELDEILVVNNGKMYTDIECSHSLGPVIPDRWYDFAIAVDGDTLQYDYYLDGQKVYSRGTTLTRSSISSTSAAAFFKLNGREEKDAVSSLTIKNLRQYYNDTPMTADELYEAAEHYQKLEPTEGEYTTRLKEAVALAAGTSSTMAFGKKQKIDNTSTDIQPYRKGTDYMVPARYLADCYGIQIEWLGQTREVALKQGEKQARLQSEQVNERAFVSAKEFAAFSGQKLFTTEDGLILFSSREQFFELPKEEMPAKILVNMLISSNYGPRIYSDETTMDKVKERINIAWEPYQKSWEETKKRADDALTKEFKIVLVGYLTYFNNAISVAGYVRDLAFVYGVTGEEKYAQRARDILMEWASVDDPNPVADVVDKGLVVSRAMVTFAYGYTLMYDYFTDSERDTIEYWFRECIEIIAKTHNHWLENDCFGGQLYQNHATIHLMGILGLGFVVQDVDWVYYCLGREDNWLSFQTLYEGAIFMEGEPLYKNDPTLMAGKPPAQNGEIYDRYRNRTLKGLQYAHLHTKALAATAETLYLNGFDFFNYTAPGGENLRLPFEFYADFYLTGDSSIKGGYYSDEKVKVVDAEMYALAIKHYPDSAKIREVVLELNMKSLWDAEHFGYTSYLAYVDVPEESVPSDKPRVEGLRLDGEDYPHFRTDKFRYDIPRKSTETHQPEITFITDATVSEMAPQDGKRRFFLTDKQDPSKTAVYQFGSYISPVLAPPEHAEKLEIKNVTCSSEQSEAGNYAVHAFDGDLNTRWAAEGEQWIVFDFGENKQIDQVGIAWISGDVRAYRFEVDVSADGNLWKKVFDGSSSGNTTDVELIPFPSSAARYIRVRGHGSDVNKWNNIAELWAYTKSE